MCAQPPGRGTDQVADVLDQEKVDLVQRQTIHRVPYHPRIQMASPGRVQMHGDRARPLGPLGIHHRRAGIAVDHADPEPPFEPLDRPFDQRSLTRARGGHQIQRHYSGGIQLRPVLGRDFPVRAQHVLRNLNRLYSHFILRVLPLRSTRDSTPSPTGFTHSLPHSGHRSSSPPI